MFNDFFFFFGGGGGRVILLQDTLVSAPPCEETEFIDDEAAEGVSAASSLESVGALTDGAVACGMFPCLSLMESSFLDSMEGVTPKVKQQTSMSSMLQIKQFYLHLDMFKATILDKTS